MKKTKGFTLVEVIATLIVLTIILLIAVPVILGVIDEARRDAFRASVLNVFKSVELGHSDENGLVPDLNMNNNNFKTGNWQQNKTNGKIVLDQVCDGSFKVTTIGSDQKENMIIEKDDGTCSFEIILKDNNPDDVACSLTDKYIDSGGMYGTKSVISLDRVDLRYAGSYLLNYYYGDVKAVRKVNVINNNLPILELTHNNVVISSTNTTFKPSDYIKVATDNCEGDIKNKVSITTDVILGVTGTYTVTYTLSNLGGKSVTKTMNVQINNHELIVNGNNPDNVSCHASNNYTDQGAKYNFDESIIKYAPTLSLKNAGTYSLNYNYTVEGMNIATTRTVNISNTNKPNITLSANTVNLYIGDVFNASNYLTSVIDPCEGDIKSLVTTNSTVNMDVVGTYTVTYKVANKGGVEDTKTLTVVVQGLPNPSVILPAVDGINDWYKTNQNITVNYDKAILGSYEYAISTNGGANYSAWTNTASNTFVLNQNSANIKFKVRGKRGTRYTAIIESAIIKMDTQAPTISNYTYTVSPNSITVTEVTASDNIEIAIYRHHIPNVWSNNPGIASSTATIPGLAGNTTYSVEVCAYDHAGNTACITKNLTTLPAKVVQYRTSSYNSCYSTYESCSTCYSTCYESCTKYCTRTVSYDCNCTWVQPDCPPGQSSCPKEQYCKTCYRTESYACGTTSCNPYDCNPRDCNCRNVCRGGWNAFTAWTTTAAVGNSNLKCEKRTCNLDAASNITTCEATVSC